MIDIMPYKNFIIKLDNILQSVHKIKPILIYSAGIKDFCKDKLSNENIHVMVDVNLRDIKNYFNYYNLYCVTDICTNIRGYYPRLVANLGYSTYAEIDMNFLPIYFRVDQNYTNIDNYIETEHTIFPWFYHDGKFYGKHEYLTQRGIIS